MKFCFFVPINFFLFLKDFLIPPTPRPSLFSSSFNFFFTHTYARRAKNYTRIYKGSQEGGLVLARELPSVDRVRGVLLVKLQNIAGCYRVGSVFVSTRAAYLENRELLWGTTPSIRLQRENPPRTREFTGPKGASDDSILSNIEKEINTLKTGGSSGEPFQAEGGDQIGSIADRLRQSKKRDNIT